MSDTLRTASCARHARLFRLTWLWLTFWVIAGTLFGGVAARAQTPPAVKRTLQVALRANDPAQSFRVLCYHDVRDNLAESMQAWPDATAIDTSELIRHFSWLLENGYHPVSLQQIADAREGRARLPEKAVLLTFDDGYKSVYTKVFPLLKQFGFPAVVAIVGDWIETPPASPVRYGDQLLARSNIVVWSELREMVASGLVEVASHSHAMHTGVTANPQGNSVPAAIARRYWPQTSRYESEEEYAARVKADLKRNADLIQRELAVRPRAMVWPYGVYNLKTAEWAAEAGMPITMNLERGPNTVQDSLRQIRRTLVTQNRGLSGLIEMLRESARVSGAESLERIIHVDLDYVFDPNPVQQEANLSALLDRMVRLRPTTVYLQAYADPDGDGVADALYFPNRHMPVRADLFSRVAWQLRTRADVKVYAWMPVMAFRLPAGHPAADRVVQTVGPPAAARDRYHRLSLFDPLVRKTISEIYDDLGTRAVFSGVLFHDDATLSNDEDASPAALSAYRDQWQLPASVEAIRKDAGLRKRWTQHKTTYINDFTLHLANVLRQHHPSLLTARNLYAKPVLEPESEDWFAQSFPGFLKLYDFTAIMAMPYMEGASSPGKWLDQLVSKVKTTPGALDKTVFELQSRDWKSGKPVPAETLAAHWRRLHLAGARHWGYYPDDFLKNQPEESTIKPAISAETFPGRR
jgi:biofilm PGA synthesis lipoprotein PgaB